MRYSLHPEAREHLWEAAQFYQAYASNELVRALFAEFQRSVNLLLSASRPWFALAKWKTPLADEALSLFTNLSKLSARRSEFSPLLIIAAAWLLARAEVASYGAAQELAAAERCYRCPYAPRLASRVTTS